MMLFKQFSSTSSCVPSLNCVSPTSWSNLRKATMWRRGITGHAKFSTQCFEVKIIPT